MKFPSRKGTKAFDQRSFHVHKAFTSQLTKNHVYEIYIILMIKNTTSKLLSYTI